MKNRRESKLANTDKNLIVLNGLKGAVLHIIEQLDTNAYKLATINDKSNKKVKQECRKHYRKVVKLKSIANELIEGIESFTYKMKRSASLVASRNNIQPTIESFLEELSLLNEMTFNTGKIIFPFIIREHKAKVINLMTMAA